MTDEAIPAATLIMVRERPDGAPEVLMVERAGRMAFAAGALVFPGGRIDDADVDLAAEIGSDAALVAAIRETLEETAIAVGLEPVPDRASALDLQQKLLGGAALGDLLRSAGLAVQSAALQPFARWVPQFHAVRRFDTMFYVAKAPPGDWQPNVVAGECAGAEWVPAAEVLERERLGQARLIFPTRRTLERLAQHGSFHEIQADALAHPVEAITPWVEDYDGTSFITIPDHLGFPVVRERLDGLWRG